MPRLRPNALQKRNEIISAWQGHYGLTDEQAAKMIGFSLSTLKQRRQQGNWRLEEIHRAIRAFHIPAPDALELLTVGCLPMEQFMDKEKRKRYGN